jgi:hypothetical protein
MEAGWRSGTQRHGESGGCPQESPRRRGQDGQTKRRTHACVGTCTRPGCREEERRERLTTNDALSYLREVKTRFQNNRKVYDRWAVRNPTQAACIVQVAFGPFSMPRVACRGCESCSMPAWCSRGVIGGVGNAVVGVVFAVAARLLAHTPLAATPLIPRSFLEIMKQFKAQS